MASQVGKNPDSASTLLCVLGLLRVKCRLGAPLRVAVGVELLLMFVYQLNGAESG